MNKITNAEIFKAKNADELLNDLRGFEQYFERLRANYGFEMQIKFLEHYYSQNPMFKNRLFSLYLKCMNAWGDSRLGLEISRIMVETSKKISDVGQNLYGLPLINENNLFVARVGELFDQAASTLLQRQLGTINHKPILILPPDQLAKINYAAIPYLEDCYEIVTEQKEVAYYQINKNFSPYFAFFFKFSDKQYGHNSYFAVDCFSDLKTQNINPCPFELKDITIDRAMKFLKNYGLKIDDKFVVLHLREEGYADAKWHVHRNTNPYSYVAAIEYFLDQGLKVIRIGNKKMSYMLKSPGFIDLTKEEKPPEVDIFLSAHAKFYFGSASGPSSISFNFGVPCCLVGANIAGVRHNNFIRFLKFKNISTGKIITLDEVEALNLKDVFAPKPLADRGLLPIVPNSNDNLNFAKEIIQYFDKGNIFHLNEKYKPQRNKHKILGGLCTDSLSLLT